MAKFKTAAWECHSIECQNCFEGCVVRDVIREEDIVICPTCGARNEITAMCADYREGKKKLVVVGESFG